MPKHVRDTCNKAQAKVITYRRDLKLQIIRNSNATCPSMEHGRMRFTFCPQSNAMIHPPLSQEAWQRNTSCCGVAHLSECWRLRPPLGSFLSARHFSHVRPLDTSKFSRELGRKLDRGNACWHTLHVIWLSAALMARCWLAAAVALLVGVTGQHSLHMMPLGLRLRQSPGQNSPRSSERRQCEHCSHSFAAASLRSTFTTLLWFPPVLPNFLPLALPTPLCWCYTASCLSDCPDSFLYLHFHNKIVVPVVCLVFQEVAWTISAKVSL